MGVRPAPDETAVRTALWRALHLELDAAPHVLADEVGLRLADPDPDWRDRPDMDPERAGRFRAGMVARARFVEDLVTGQVSRGVGQYVILGAGLDTFAQRRPDVAARLQIFEVDRPGPQAWKRQRLVELGYGVPEGLHLVPVDFETDDWWQRLVADGFDPRSPAVVASCGVSMYLTGEVNTAALRRLATLAAGSTVVMTFLLPADQLPEPERAGFTAAQRGARAAGTPFLSFFDPEQMLALAGESGFARPECVSTDTLDQRYFAHRADGLAILRGEQLLVAMT